MSRRLSPKEIKEDIRHDELSTGLERVVDWVVLHKREAAIGLAAVVTAGVVAAGVQLWLERQSRVAADKLATALETYSAPLAGEATDPEAPKNDAPRFATEAERRAAARPLFEAVDGVGAGDSGDVARLFLAEIALREGDAKRAEEIWRGYLDGHQGDALAASVRVNLFRLERRQGGAEKVAEELRKELDQPGGDLPDDVVLFELAETLEELGQAGEAKELYQRLVDEHPQSPFTSKARQRTDEPA